jgi:hypothetical protein
MENLSYLTERHWTVAVADGGVPEDSGVKR